MYYLACFERKVSGNSSHFPLSVYYCCIGISSWFGNNLVIVVSLVSISNPYLYILRIAIKMLPKSLDLNNALSLIAVFVVQC